MGTLRFLLAATVACGHIRGQDFRSVLTDSGTAVQAFYIISGFLITFILNERYSRVDDFYRSRLLRLMPGYYFWLLFTALAFISVGWSVPALQKLRELAPEAAIYVLASNIVIIGQDLAYWLTFDSRGSLHFTLHFWAEKNPIYPFFIVGPAWSLSLELMFYTIAPWVVRRGWAVLTVFVASETLRYVTYREIGYGDPFGYRAFPLELGTFMMGAGGYYLLKIYRRMAIPKYACDVAVASIWLIAIGFQWLPAERTFLIFTDAQIIFYATLIFLLPLAFLASGRHPIDRFLGELSYPLYLGHIAVIAVVVTKFGALSKNWQVCLMLAVASLLAAGCYLFIERPVDRFRHSRFLHRQSAESGRGDCDAELKNHVNASGQSRSEI